MTTDLTTGDGGMDLRDAIRVALRGQWPELFRPTPRPTPKRDLPPGVYNDRGRALHAQFFRRVDGKQIIIRVARGERGDFSPRTAERLARACADAAAVWDEEHDR